MDMAEISTVDKPKEANAAAIPKIPHTTTSGEDTTPSETRFVVASATIPQNQIGTILESNTSAFKGKTAVASCIDHVTFENNHSSISSQTCKTSSGGVDAQNGDFSTLSKDITWNADSTASIHISGKGYVSSISSEDGTASANKETVAGFENICTMAGDPYTSPTNMATNEDTIAATSGINLVSTSVLEDICSANNSEEVISDLGGISNIFSGGKNSGPIETFSVVSTGDTTIAASSLSSVLAFVDTNGNQAASGPVGCTAAEGDIIVPGDFTASPISDSGEVSHMTFKKDSTSAPEDTTALLQGGTAGVFPTDTSGTIPTTEYTISDQSLPVASRNISGLPCNESNTAIEGIDNGPGGTFADGNKTGTIFRESNTSAFVVSNTTPGDACKTSTEALNVCRNIASTTSLESIGCAVTTESGNTSVITGKNTRALGNITTTHLDNATIDEPSLVIPGNVTDTAGTEGTVTVTPRNMSSTFRKIPTASMTQGDTSSIHDGETSKIMSSGSSVKTANCTEKATIDSEYPTTEPNSKTVSGNTNATVCIAITGVGDNKAGEDSHSSTPEQTDNVEATGSPQNGTIIIDGHNCNTARKNSSGDSMTRPPFGEITASSVSVSASTPAIQGYAFANPAGNPSVSCGSTIASEDSDGDKVTTSFGDSAILGNDKSIMHREDMSSISDDAPIASSSGETFTVPQDNTLNIATTILSQNVSVYSAREQVGQYSETVTRKASTVVGNSTNTHRDTTATEVTLTSPTNTVIIAAAITSTTNKLENGNSATSRRPAPTSYGTKGMISEEVTATMSEDVTETKTSRNTTTIHFEAATFVSSAELQSTNVTSLCPRETTCSTENDMKKTSSGCTLNFCVSTSAAGELLNTVTKDTSIGEPILEFTSIYRDTPDEIFSPDSASAYNIIQDRRLSVATTADEKKTPSDPTMVVPKDISPGPATIISVLSKETNASALEDAANNTIHSTSISATGHGDPTVDSHYDGKVTSPHSGTHTILESDSSLSARTNFQEASKDPGDTTTVFGYSINLTEDAQICHEFASVHSKVPTTFLPTTKISDTHITLGGCISTETATQSESTPTANAASTSADDRIHSETLNAAVTIGTKNIIRHKGTENLNTSLIPDSISSAVFSGIFEATAVPKENRHTTAITEAHSDAVITTSTKSTEAPSAGSSGDFMKTTTLLKDTTTFTTTSTGATTTVTALKDTVMTTQTSMRDIATVPRNKSATILEDTSTPREIVAKIAATTHGDIGEVLIPGAGSCKENPESNITPKETLGNGPSDYYISRIATDSLATANITSILSDTISTPNNVNSMLEITTSPEIILASRNNCTNTFHIQSQTIIPEAPISEAPVTEAPETEKASSAAEKNITIITTSDAQIGHTVPKGTTMTNTPEDETNRNVAINNSENTTGLSVSPREIDTPACIPLASTDSANRKTVPSRQRSYSENAANTSTCLEEGCAPSHYSSTEGFSTLASTSHRDAGQLVGLITPCLSTISVSENTLRASESSTGFGNATAPTLFLQGTGQSIATGDSTTLVTTTSVADLADAKIITTAPGDIGTDVAKYAITSTTVSEDTITAPDLVILRNKDAAMAVGGIHARASTANGDAISADRDTTSGPARYKADAGVSPTCPAMASLGETLIPSPMTASEDTNTLAAAADVIRKPPATATTVVSGKYLTPEATTVVEGMAVSGITTTSRETFVPKITASFTEASISRPATKFSSASFSEATIPSAETLTDAAFPPSEQATACQNISSAKSIPDGDIIAVATSSVTPSFVSTSFLASNTDRKGLTFEDRICSADGHPHHSANTTGVAEDVAGAVAEETTTVFGNNCIDSEGPVTIPLGKNTDSPTEEIPTIPEGDFITATGIIHTAKPRDMTDITTTESTITTPRRTAVDQGETPVMTPGEKTAYTTTETATITEGTISDSGKILTATHSNTNIVTFGKTTDSAAGVPFVASAVSPRETLAATPGGIPGITCASTSQLIDDSCDVASTTPEETVVGIPREAATVQLGKATETIARDPHTITRRRISITAPQETFAIAHSRANSAFTPGEIPNSAFAEEIHEAPPVSVLRNDKPIAVDPEDPCMDSSSKTASASQEKNRLLEPVTLLPCWSIMLIGITVIVFLVAGFCMVIYYVTFFILVAYSASLSSSTFS